MNFDLTHKNAAPVKPIRDTWGKISRYHAFWSMFPNINVSSFSVQENNEWFATIIEQILEIWDNFGRIWNIYFNFMSDPNDYESIKNEFFKWEIDTPYNNYVDKVLKTIRSCSLPIYDVSLEFDLLVYVSTQESPKHLIRCWVRDLGDVNIMGGILNDPEPYVTFSLDTSLFCKQHFLYENNQELYTLNHPLLENFLRTAEKKIGEIKDIQGPDVFKYGFLSEYVE